MTRLTFVVLLGGLLSLALFPWPLTALLALVSALFFPLAPVALGIMADALYWSPNVSALPLATIAGALVGIAASVLRSRLQESIIAS